MYPYTQNNPLKYTLCYTVCPPNLRNVVHYLVYDGVPVEGLVLLHVAGVAGGGAQVGEGDLRPHGAGRHGAVEPVHVVTQTRPSLGEHQGVCPHLNNIISRELEKNIREVPQSRRRQSSRLLMVESVH